MTTERAMTVSGTLLNAARLGLERLDAQLLLLHALGKPASNRAWLLAHDLDALPDSVNAAFMALAQRRMSGEPVAYLTGHKEFFGLDLRVDARVLVPRPDTETLVQWALKVLDLLDGLAARIAADPSDLVGPLRAVDLGTGSGAVALAIKLSRPGVDVSATDVSADALAVAQANAQRLQLDVKFSRGSWLQGLAEVGAAASVDAAKACYHLIVSNPPYIAARDPHLAALTHEPVQALVSGGYGLDDIRTIISQAPQHLHPGGWLLLEHGYDQASLVREVLCSAGFSDVQSRHDFGGIERCSGGRWPEIRNPAMG